METVAPIGLEVLRRRWRRFRWCSWLALPAVALGGLFPSPYHLIGVAPGIAVFLWVFVEQFRLANVLCPSCNGYFFSPQGKRRLGAWVFRSKCGSCGLSISAA